MIHRLQWFSYVHGISNTYQIRAIVQKRDDLNKFSQKHHQWEQIKTSTRYKGNTNKKAVAKNHEMAPIDSSTNCGIFEWQPLKFVLFFIGKYLELAQKERLSYDLLFQLFSRDNDRKWINRMKCYLICLDEFSIWLTSIITYLSRYFKITIAAFCALCKFSEFDNLNWLSWVNFLIGSCRF